MEIYVFFEIKLDLLHSNLQEAPGAVGAGGEPEAEEVQGDLLPGGRLDAEVAVGGPRNAARVAGAQDAAEFAVVRAVAG